MTIELDKLAEEIGKILVEKNKAYGSAFDKAEKFLMILYPNGVPVDQYQNVLCFARMFDKMMRIATDKDAFGESPYQDMAGYSILGLKKSLENKSTK